MTEKLAYGPLLTLGFERFYMHFQISELTAL